MDLSGSDVSPPGESECDDAALRQLLVELQQLTKQQTSYTTVLQSLNQRQNVVNDRLLQTVDCRATWNRLKDIRHKFCLLRPWRQGKVL